MSTVSGRLRTRFDSAAGRPSSRLLGPQPVRDLAQLGDRGAELGDALVEQPVDVDGAVVEVPLGQPQLHAERDQPLLGAVVEVALQPAALVVADLDQPRPAGLGLAQGAGHLRAEPDHLDQGAAAAGDLAEQLGRRGPGAADEDAGLLVVEQHRHAVAAGTGSPAGVQEGVRPRHPEADPQPGVAQRLAQHRLAARAGPARR